MSQIARIVKLYNLIKERGPISAKRLTEKLETSRATVMRDIVMLRDQLNLPIAYDRDRAGYIIDNRTSQYGPRYELPGLWLSSHEAYALLTLINVLREIGPELVVPYVMPLRRTLKGMLNKNTFKMLGLDRKISIELGNKDALRAGPTSEVSAALLNDKQLDLAIREDDGRMFYGEFSPQRLALTGKGWFLDALCHATNNLRRIAMAAICDAKLIDTTATIVEEPSGKHV